MSGNADNGSSIEHPWKIRGKIWRKKEKESFQIESD
jgi:hypothetical protein